VYGLPALERRFSRGTMVKLLHRRTKSKMSETPLHMMLIPAVVLIVIYRYLPMAGVTIAFQDFIPAKGLFGNQTWVGFRNFAYVFNMPNFSRVLFNTIYIAFAKLALGVIVPLTVSLLLNELSNQTIKRSVQTMIYLPRFLSWVILGGILVNILSPSSGIINRILSDVLGLDPVFFLGDNDWFRFTIIVSDTWQDFGWGTIIYLATISGIDPNLYEAAVMDGASRWKQTWHVTLPGMSHIIVLLMTLSLGRLLNAGFDQIFNLYSPIVYETGDIIDTLVYRIGLVQAQFGVSTAIGLFKSVVSLVLISTSYFLAYRLTDYQIF
jgi:putative aldouronate transport system permease protein